MRALCVLAIFVGAAQLFLIQPFMGRLLVPVLGGSPAVWNTCMVFFQAALLAGYLFAHVLGKLRPLAQVAVHGGALLLALAWLPVGTSIGEPGSGNPQVWLLGVLAGSVGVPFVVASATSPLVQRWFSVSGDRASHDPYFLYAASNAGSLLGLLAYPLLIEPNLSRHGQSQAWALGYGLLVITTLAAGVAVLRSARAQRALASSPPPSMPEARDSPASRAPLSARTIAHWLVLALVPSALTLGVTQHIATDVASIPMVWMVPLGLYLISFILAFARGAGLVGLASRWGSVGWARALPIAIIPVALALVAGAQSPLLLVVGLHLGAFFIACMVCHCRLAEMRPDASKLTGYYLTMSVGGVVGSGLCALLAPVVTDAVYEYPVALALACALRPQVREEYAAARTSVQRVRWVLVPVVLGMLLLLGVALLDASQQSIRQWIFARVRALPSGDQADPRVLMTTAIIAGVPCVLLACTLVGKGALRFAGALLGVLVGAQLSGSGGSVLHRERSFFGVHKVVASVPSGQFVTLMHGTTKHGVQVRREGQGLDIATTYYHQSGPLGDVFRVLRARGAGGATTNANATTNTGTPIRAGLVGLGAGTIASYAQPGDLMRFYEIDPAVVRIAEDPRLFTFLRDARARADVTIECVVADGRLGLARAEPASYDLIVIDAFSSDAIPTHLLTREALAIYLRALKPDGVIALHISSRYFDLAPVVYGMASDQALSAPLEMRFRWDFGASGGPEEVNEARQPSTWAVITRDARNLGPLVRNVTWSTPQREELSPVLWTDDYANPLGVLAGW